MNSRLKFTTHINEKGTKARQQLGMIKQAIHGAAKEAKPGQLRQYDL